MTQQRRGAVFLDRDGTIARYREYCRSPEEFDLLPGVGEAIRKLNDANVPVVVMTNQSAVGRGWLTMETLSSIHEKMQQELARVGARIDAIYVCPHHPDDGCACRKPGTHMLTKAADELGLSLTESYVIGDRWQDVQTGRGAGSRAILVKSGHPAEPANGTTADYEAPTLGDAVDWLLQQRQQQTASAQTDWSTRYRALAERLYEVRRACPRFAVLGTSTLHPRHSLPADQVELADRPQEDAPWPIPSWPRIITHALKLAVYAAQETANLVWISWHGRGMLRRLSQQPATVVMKTWCFGPQSFDAARDFYYGTVPHQLQAKGISTVVLCGDTRERCDLAFLTAFLREGAVRYVPEWLLLPWWAPMITLCRQLWGALSLRRVAQRAASSSLAAVAATACVNALTPITMRNLLQYHIARAAVKRWNAGAFVTLYEGQPWEQPAWHGARAANPSCRLVGYQHTVIMPHSLAVRRPQSIGKEIAAPDIVLCLGETTRRMIAPGHQPHGNRLITFGTCRRPASRGSARGPRPDLRTVLVLPEGFQSEARLLFRFAMNVAAIMPDHRFIFRSHPVLPFSQVRPHLQRDPAQMTNIEISTRKTIEEDFSRASVVLYRGSSTVLYAVLHGVKPIYVHDAAAPDVDPLFELSAWREGVEAATQAHDRLAAYATGAVPSAAAEWLSAAAYVDQYVIPVDEAAIDRFIDAFRGART
ncbi:MAG: HAD-IIIA family hydrolase [Candidatus Omnitrophica bacterium]|nr:HAD-IIIA family hydrolase [Candidatus Omnitrophota bacterium]